MPIFEHIREKSCADNDEKYAAGHRVKNDCLCCHGVRFGEESIKYVMLISCSRPISYLLRNASESGEYCLAAQ